MDLTFAVIAVLAANLTVLAAGMLIAAVRSKRSRRRRGA